MANNQNESPLVKENGFAVTVPGACIFVAVTETKI